MMQALLAVGLQAALLVILLTGSRRMPAHQINEGLLSISETKALQGLLAILIVFHHCAQRVVYDLWWQGVSFTGLGLVALGGFLFVGYFLFCSGYGLMKSSQAKEGYLDGFLRRRPLPLLGVFYIVNTLYLAGRLAAGETFEPARLASLALGFELANPNSWYVIALPLFYVLFYVAKRRTTDERQVVRWLFAGTFAYILLGLVVTTLFPWVGYVVFVGKWWYNAAILFPLGYLFALKEEAAVSWIRRNIVRGTFVSVLLLVVGLASSYQVSMIPLAWEDRFGLRLSVALVTEVLESIAVVGFVGSMIAFSAKRQIESPLLGFFGSITLELYLMHGYFVYLFHEPFYDKGTGVFNIASPALYILVVLALGTVCALLLKRLTRRLMGRR